MTDKATTPTSLRLPDGLLRQLTKAAHKLEMSRTMYITTALQSAVAHDLPNAEYRQAWDMVNAFYDQLSPDVDSNGNPDRDMLIATALETVLPVLGVRK
jgi:hypothetical protein